MIAIQSSTSILIISVGENETICGPTEQDCVRATTGERYLYIREKLRCKGCISINLYFFFLPDNLEQGRYDRVCVNPVCYPPCNDVKYGAETTYLPYHTNDIFNPSRINKNK